MTVQELLKRYPRAISAFIKRDMLCVGCPTEAFHALEDVARIHGYEPEDLLASIREAIKKDPSKRNAEAEKDKREDKRVEKEHDH